jgi:hypothetical protein
LLGLPELHHDIVWLEKTFEACCSPFREKEKALMIYNRPDHHGVGIARRKSLQFIINMA